MRTHTNDLTGRKINSVSRSWRMSSCMRCYCNLSNHLTHSCLPVDSVPRGPTSSPYTMPTIGKTHTGKLRHTENSDWKCQLQTRVPAATMSWGWHACERQLHIGPTLAPLTNFKVTVYTLKITYSCTQKISIWLGSNTCTVELNNTA